MFGANPRGQRVDEKDRWREIGAIVGDLLDEEDGSAELAPADPELRRRVASYLVRSPAGSPVDQPLVERVGELMEQAFDLNSTEPAEHLLTIGEEVGSFRIEGVLGEGGMGTVFLAQRADGSFDQEVALKLLHRAPSDAAARQRFLQERQILAGLKHPNIARLIDGGVVRGLPYLVMERIDGLPITRYSEERQLSTEERVRLVLQACGAIRHAHREGIIHRDLKPSNLLVEDGVADGMGEPKLVVLDFGIARVEHAETRMTSTGQIFGTPGYMAAEQVLGGRAGGDRRSDVFALGVVLYELLGGQRPFGDGEPLDVLQRVLDGEFVPLRRVLPNVSIDLATIVETCIAREPARRYDSMRALAEDLERYLDGAPIAARPVRWIGRWWRRARRQPRIAALVVGALLVTLVSLGLLVMTAVRYTRALAVERNAAVEARQDAEGLLNFMLEDLHGGLDEIGRLDLLEQVAVKALDYYSRRPARNESEIFGRAIALGNTGEILEAQGDLDRAAEAYAENLRLFSDRAAADPRPEWLFGLARNHRAMAGVRVAESDLDGALLQAEKAVGFSRRVGDDSRFEDWTKIHFESLALLGWTAREAGQPEKALEALGEALNFVQKHAEGGEAPETWQNREAVVRSYIGLVHHQNGDPARAAQEFEMAREIGQRLMLVKASHSGLRAEYQLALSRLGSARFDLGEFEAAITAFEAALQQSSILVGIEPENTGWQRELAVAHASLALTRRELGDLQGAATDLKKSLEISRSLVERFPDHPDAAHDLAWDLLDLGLLRRELGDEEGAQTALAEALALSRKIRLKVPDSPFYRHAEVQVLLELGRRDEARPLVRQLHQMGWKAVEFLELVTEHGLESELTDDADVSDSQ